MHDLHNNIRTKTALKPAAGTTAAGRTGMVIDRMGYGGVTFVVAYGEMTATAATITIGIKEGAVSGTLTSVADADLLGTEVLASVAAGARTSGVGKNVSKRIGYRGNKRYVQLNITAATTTVATITSALAILHSPLNAPTANP